MTNSGKSQNSGAQPYGSASRSRVLFDALQGRWRVAYSELDGKMTSPEDFTSIVLENRDHEFVVYKGEDTVHRGTFTLDVTKVPARISYVYKESDNPLYLTAPRPGILQLEGDTLKTCMGLPGQKFPLSFSTFVDSESVLSIHQRDGKHQERGFATKSLTRAVSQW